MDLDILVADLDGVVVAALDLIVDSELYWPLASCSSRSNSKAIWHTPFRSLVAVVPSTLHQIVTEEIRNLDRMVDLHPGINSNPTILIEILAGFLPGSEEDS